MRPHIFFTILCLLGLSLLLVSCGEEKTTGPAGLNDTVFLTDTLIVRDTLRLNGGTGTRPKFVFLFIGDGMGLSHIALTEAYQASLAGDDIGFTPLSFSKFPVHGTVTTHAALYRTTESAGAASAMASGFKAPEEMLGFDVNRQQVSLFTDEAKALQKAVGIVSNMPLDHATPAGFYAHQQNRRHFYLIGLDLIASRFDFFAGGNFSDPDGVSIQTEVVLETPPQPLENLAIAAGYQVTRGRAALDGVTSTPLIALGPSVPYLMDRSFVDADRPTLMDLTAAAIRLLPRENGFFVLVESGRIDAASHANDARGVISEVQALDSAVQVALTFAAQFPSETLILVTSDHETGGLGISTTRMVHRPRLGLLRHQLVSNSILGDSLQALRLAMAQSPPEEIRAAYYAMLGRLTGLGQHPEMPIGLADSIMLDEGLDLGMREVLQLTPTQREFYGGDRDGLNHPMLLAALRTVGHRAGVGWSTVGHTPAHVPVYAFGAGQEYFAGRLDNTDFAWIMRDIFLGQDTALIGR